MPTPFFADLVRELCQEGGTGPLTPTGAVPGHRRFADAVPADAVFHYAIAGIAWAGQWETGLGRIDGNGRLVRETVAASSSGSTPVDFTPGLKTIALTVGAGWFSASAAAQSAQAAALAAKQPLSTGHDAVTAGAAGDLITARRGSGWVNIPISALVFRDAGGAYAVGGQLGGADGSVGAPGIAFASDSNTGLYRPGADMIGFVSGGVERARLTSTGMFGLGVSGPVFTLDVQAVNGNQLARFKDSDSSYNGVIVSADTGGGWVGDSTNQTGQGLNFTTSTNSLRFFTTGAVRAVIEAGGAFRPNPDNVQTLGTAGFRWSAVYAGTGTINTSDAREKMWRGAPAEAELRAAKRIAAELGFYQWNDAIAEKGVDGARHHFGVRAQSVWSIMADEGLVEPIDGGQASARYAFLCHDAWVDGTGQPPADRFGIRPDQLALFLIAAQEARLAALEAAT